MADTTTPAPSPLDDLISPTAAARKARWGTARFRAFAAARGLLIEDGGGPARRRFVVRWSEVERAILQRPRYVPPEPEPRAGRRRPGGHARPLPPSLTTADVYC